MNTLIMKTGGYWRGFTEHTKKYQEKFSVYKYGQIFVYCIMPSSPLDDLFSTSLYLNFIFIEGAAWS